MASHGERLSRIVCRLGLPRATRAAVTRGRAAILLYHDPEPEVLATHLEYLKSAGYAFVSLDALVEALERGTFSGLPVRPVIVTIDDGHRGNRDLTEVFARYGVVPTIYLCSQIVATTRHYWFLDTPDPEPLKRMANHERLARLSADVGFDQATEHGDEHRQSLSREEIAAMSGTVDFGSHTRFHPILPMCDPATAEREIRESRTEVASLTGRACTHFAFPNGDFSERDVELVRAAGYRSARTTRIGWTGPRTDPYRLPILGVPDDASVTRLAADLTGVTSWLAHHWPPFRLRRPGGSSG